MSRKTFTPRETIETLLRADQLRLQGLTPSGADDTGMTYRRAAECRPIILCRRTGKEITLDNVHQVEVEHWPMKHEHGGPASPENAIISLADGHARQTKREARDKAHERKLRIARLAKADVEKKIGGTKWRLKKKLDGRVVRVRTK
jgi:hypothetical protein